ncbi:hypothetical protein JHD48_06525 [Sulfurimonas sp. SAG-AH-194-I05]|nr:ATP-binding protein [Sulfurimonas sp. SAG-AH-194-I05]MDF1875383.1 hypothetical protein [Sulfurimonas sp. SAG-AH-194-I05]
MNQDEINTLLTNFALYKEDLEQRIVLKEFSHSIASIIIDEFAEKYLRNNPHLSLYLAHTDGSMLLKKMKDFIAFFLIDPIDTSYIEKIQNIGFIHYSLKLEPSKVSYGFWAMNEILEKISLSNPLVAKNKALISRLFRFVEHVMNDGYTLQKEKSQRKSISDLENINVQNELYIGFNIHKLNIKKVQLAILDKQNFSVLDDIKEESSQCSFGRILQKLQGNKQYEFILGVSSSRVNQIHDQWHKEFRSIKKALQIQDEGKIAFHNNAITKLTNELASILDTTLKDSLNDGQLALRSSIRAMRIITKLFYEKSNSNIENTDITDIVRSSLQKVVLSEFSWAIEKIEVTDKMQANAHENQITKVVRYRSTNIFIFITLKDAQDTSYINEMLYLLLEVLELHFFVQEREVSLITFADKAESANKSKDMFLANMSHELRTPINAITGFSQILMMKKDTPDKVKKYVKKINIAGNNLLDLVNTILDFAKLESGKMQFNPSLSNISDVITEVRTLTQPLADKKNIALHFPNIISLNLYIDKVLFKQVLINLLTNALKFTHENGEVSLSITFNEKKHSYDFEVKDNGVGLEQDEIAKLFQAFSQIDNTYQKEHKGSGLGLMISKNIIEDLHQGKIWVESVKGEGSSFFIEMPTPEIESHTYRVNKAPEGSQNILIVEDSVEYQKILSTCLQETHNMTITDTVNKAKELITKNKYDFLILDFFLTDGISSEILNFMEAENISIPSIVISAEDEICISSSLSGSSNLQCIVNKKNIHEICASLRGEEYCEKSL